MTKGRNMKRKRKKRVLGLMSYMIALVIVGSGLLIYRNYTQQVTIARQEARYQKLSKEMKHLTLDEYLARDLDVKKIEKMQKKVNTSKDKILQSKYKVLQDKLSLINTKLVLQEAVNNLFKTPALNGLTLIEEEDKDNITVSDIDKIDLSILPESVFKTTLVQLKSEAKTKIEVVSEDNTDATEDDVAYN